MSVLAVVAQSLERQNANMEAMQTMALTMGNMLTTIAEEQRMLRHDLTTESTGLKRRLEALEEAQLKSSSVPLKNLDASGPLRYALRYLMTAGMDTRTGLVCAFPVMYGKSCHVMISLHLLKFSFNRVFKSHSIKDRSLAMFLQAFSSLNAIAPRDTVDRALQVLPIVPERQKNNNWVKLPAARFVEMCLEMEDRYPLDNDDTTWTTDHLWENDDPLEVDMPARMRHDTSSADNYEKRDKIAWNVPVWRDILESEAVREYVRLVATAKKEEVPGVCHFSGIELFPLHTVEDHPRVKVRPGKQLPQPSSHPRGKHPRQAESEENEPKHRRVESPGSESDSGSDEELDNLLALCHENDPIELKQ